MEDAGTSLLEMERFCGKEYYPVKEATWHIYKGDAGEKDELWLEIRMDKGQNLNEDTEFLAARPHWELTYRAQNLDESVLVSGFKAEIAESYNEEEDDYDTNFYYCEQESTQKNVIEILDRDEKDRLYIRLHAEVQDVNFYDGSKPASKLLLEAWFAKK